MKVATAELSSLVDGIKAHIAWAENGKSNLFDFRYGKDQFTNEELDLKYLY